MRNSERSLMTPRNADTLTGIDDDTLNNPKYGAGRLNGGSLMNRVICELGGKTKDPTLTSPLNRISGSWKPKETVAGCEFGLTIAIPVLTLPLVSTKKPSGFVDGTDMGSVASETKIPPARSWKSANPSGTMLPGFARTFANPILIGPAG